MHQGVQTKSVTSSEKRLSDARRYLASAAVSHVSLTVRRAREQKKAVSNVR
jgi:hypothetical protein